MGFALSGDYHSNGLASETVSCPLDYAFIHSHRHRIIAVTDCQNAPSVALLERLGFRRDASQEVSQEQETAACREQVPTCLVAALYGMGAWHFLIPSSVLVVSARPCGSRRIRGG
jgi:hypothetical protein